MFRELLKEAQKVFPSPKVNETYGEEASIVNQANQELGYHDSKEKDIEEDLSIIGDTPVDNIVKEAYQYAGSDDAILKLVLSMVDERERVKFDIREHGDIYREIKDIVLDCEALAMKIESMMGGDMEEKAKAQGKGEVTAEQAVKQGMSAEEFVKAQNKGKPITSESLVKETLELFPNAGKINVKWTNEPEISIVGNTITISNQLRGDQNQIIRSIAHEAKHRELVLSGEIDSMTPEQVEIESRKAEEFAVSKVKTKSQLLAEYEKVKETVNEEDKVLLRGIDSEEKAKEKQLKKEFKNSKIEKDDLNPGMYKLVKKAESQMELFDESVNEAKWTAKVIFNDSAQGETEEDAKKRIKQGWKGECGIDLKDSQIVDLKKVSEKVEEDHIPIKVMKTSKDGWMIQGASHATQDRVFKSREEAISYAKELEKETKNLNAPRPYKIVKIESE